MNGSQDKLISYLFGATVSALHGSSDGRRRRQIWSPRLAGVTGDGLGHRRRRSADLAGGWLAAAMVADVVATKLATTAADCGACRDAGPPVAAIHVASSLGHRFGETSSYKDIVIGLCIGFELQS
uniref:Uncharacterized protein n=1 Tax=Oryza rufipogon TaxID=4529 RepID=A0A0E0R4N1_ORYRU